LDALVISTESESSKPTNSTPLSTPSLKRRNKSKRELVGDTNRHVKGSKQEARERLGVTPEQLKGTMTITPLLKQAVGGVKGCIQALRNDDSTDATLFIAKWDSLTQTDQKYLSVEEVAIAAGLTPRRLVEVITGALMSQGDFAAKIIVASSKPDIIKRMAKEAKTALGEKDRENFLRGKDVDWFVPTKGITIDASDRRTQNNLLQAGAERALPAPRTDAFLLEISSALRPDHAQLEAPSPPVIANVPEIEYIDAGDDV
jgi:hypothetical protein